MNYADLIKLLENNGLKVTPQRVAVLEALHKIGNHPSVEQVRELLHKKHPNIAIGTIYNILDTLCEHGIIRKVKTDSDYVRYEVEMGSHHHIYNEDSDSIEDYFDPELNELLNAYFERKAIPNFQIKEINLQIVGKHIDQNKQ